MRELRRRWSIRRQRPRCSASSAARPPTCSRSSTAIVESAARVCGIDDVLLRLREGNALIATGSFWSDAHWPR